MSVERKKKVIHLFMFSKVKYDSQGTPIKVKSRLVADGSKQGPFDIDYIASPTAQLSSVLAVAAAAAIQGLVVVTADVKGAYLNAVMPEDEPVDVKLDAKTALALSALDASVKKYFRDDGSLVVSLKKALYGCRQSAKLWFLTITNLLKRIGFAQNPYDACVFYLCDEDGPVHVVIYVDDLLIALKSLVKKDWLLQSLRTEFGEVTCSEGLVHSYIGMTFDFAMQGRLTVSMTGFEDAIRTEAAVLGSVTTPALANLFEIDEQSPILSAANKSKFHTLVAKLLYLAKRTRVDLLLAVAFLTTRVQAPTAEDELKLTRVFK
jgi:hypothetical protein